MKQILQIITTFTFLTVVLALPKKIGAQNCYYNYCAVGPFCDLGCQFYSPGDYVLDGKISFYTADEKYIPHPYWDDYKDFTCKAEDCYDAPTDTWYCASDIPPDRPEDPAIRICTNQTFPNCDWTDINPYATGEIYCEIGAIRYDTLPGYYCTSEKWVCTEDGWQCTPDDINEIPCWESPHPTCRCTDGTYDVLNSGTWDCDKSNWDLPEQGECAEMLEKMNVAFSPGYVKTQTPYLFQIHQNIIGKLQNIFSIFKLDFYKAPDWPGETTLTYSFASTDGLGWAEAGNPGSSGIHYGSDAHIYFRYLGGIHCEKEKLLQRLTPILNFKSPYIFYDPRCDYEDPSEVIF